MIIELWRKVVATDYSTTCYAICGNDFDVGSVFAVVKRDDAGEMGEMCPVCLDYLNRRKLDAKDPTLDNWPASEWPRPQDFEAARRRYPEPMFETESDLVAASADRDAEAKILEASIVWRMEPERTRA